MKITIALCIGFIIGAVAFVLLILMNEAGGE